MTLPRRSQDRPVEAVKLRIALRTDRETAKRIKEAIPSAVVTGGRCEVRIEDPQPAAVIEKARAVLEKLRAIEGTRRGEEHSSPGNPGPGP